MSHEFMTAMKNAIKFQRNRQSQNHDAGRNESADCVWLTYRDEIA